MIEYITDGRKEKTNIEKLLLLFKPSSLLLPHCSQGDDISRKKGTFVACLRQLVGGNCLLCDKMIDKVCPKNSFLSLCLKIDSSVSHLYVTILRAKQFLESGGRWICDRVDWCWKKSNNQNCHSYFFSLYAISHVTLLLEEWHTCGWIATGCHGLAWHQDIFSMKPQGGNKGSYNRLCQGRLFLHYKQAREGDISMSNIAPCPMSRQVLPALACIQFCVLWNLVVHIIASPFVDKEKLGDVFYTEESTYWSNIYLEALGDYGTSAMYQMSTESACLDQKHSKDNKHLSQKCPKYQAHWFSGVWADMVVSG